MQPRNTPFASFAILIIFCGLWLSFLGSIWSYFQSMAFIAYGAAAFFGVIAIFVKGRVCSNCRYMIDDREKKSGTTKT